MLLGVVRHLNTRIVAAREPVTPTTRLVALRRVTRVLRAETGR
jgi:hypothetical protein